MKPNRMTAVVLTVLTLAVTARANIYTIGHVESGQSWLETWPTNFGPRLAITDVGATANPFYGSPHDAIGVGDLNIANAGQEFIFGRADGFGVLVDKATAGGGTPRIGDALVFRRDGVNSHTESHGFDGISIFDLHANAGNEIVTIATNTVMEIWAYDQSSGTVDTSVGSNGRLDVRIWDSISLGTVIHTTIGDFDTSASGLEIGLLRTDGFVDIFPILATTSSERLTIWSINTTSFHEPFDHFFAGDLWAATPGDEIATIGSDGWLEIYNSMTGVRLSAPANAYTASSHDPFLAVTALSGGLVVIPEPALGFLMAFGLILVARRR